MEEGLFKKYSAQIQKRKATLKEIINHIKNKTGVILQENSIIITGRQIKTKTTSTIKQKLHQKDIKQALQEIGFTLKP